MEDQLEDIRKCWSEEEGVLRQVNCYSYITQFANYHAQFFFDTSWCGLPLLPPHPMQGGGKGSSETGLGKSERRNGRQ